MSNHSVKSNIGHVRVHSVLYGNDTDRVIQTVTHLNRAADLAINAGVVESVTLVYGDSTPQPCLSADDLASIRKRSYALAEVNHVFFGANLGSALGHNTLIADAEAGIKEGKPTDHVLIMNPDVMLAPDALIELARPISSASIGLVEARQLPIEHPKEYNRTTGETEWATTACALIPLKVLRELGGFDSSAFFLYCDDVDFSWRARLAGYLVIYQPSAAVFHDKRLGANGQWAPTGSEQYYSAEAALMMARKYGRADIVARLRKGFANSEMPHLKRAAEEYAHRESEGTLPDPLKNASRVAVFNGDFYTKHRFEL